MRHLAVIIYCCLSCSAFSQQLPDPLWSAFSGGTAYSPRQKDVFAVLVNPAAVSSAANISAGMYVERRYALKDLQHTSGLIQFPIQRGGLGLQLDYNGSSRMNETAFGIVYGMPLGSQLDAGIRFRYYMLNVPGYLQTSMIWGEAGFLFKLTDHVITGFSFCRSARTRISPGEPELIQVFRMGAGYHPPGKIMFVTDWLKQTNRPFLGNCFVYYSFEEGLHLRVGWNISTSQPVAGAGINWKSIRADIMISYHPILGCTPVFQFLWQSIHPSNKQLINK